MKALICGLLVVVTLPFTVLGIIAACVVGAFGFGWQTMETWMDKLEP